MSLITFGPDGAVTVQRIELNADNGGSFEVPLNAENTKAHLVVTATTPLILTPASYTIAAEPLE